MVHCYKGPSGEPGADGEAGSPGLQGNPGQQGTVPPRILIHQYFILKLRQKY